MNYVLDSTLLIDHSHGDQAAIDMIEDLFARTGDLYTCDIVTCETLSGGTAAGREAIRGVLDALEYVALDPEGARWAGERRAERTPRSSRRHVGDALVAAVAWRLGATVVTRYARDFEPYGVPVLGYGDVAA